MATTDPLTGATINDQSDAATGGFQIGRVVTDLRRFVVPRFANAAERDSKYAAAGVVVENGMRCSVAGMPMVRINNRWDFEAYRAQWTARTARTGATDSYAPGSFVNLIQGTWVAAPPGVYAVHAALAVQAVANAAGTARLTVGGTILSEPRADVPASTVGSYAFPELIGWTGGDLAYRLDHNAGGSNNITVINPNTKMILALQGATP